MQRVTWIAVGSFAKVCGLFGVLNGLIVGLIIGIIGLMMIPIEQAGSLAVMALFSGVQLLVMPIASGVIYFVLGALAAWLYNVYARRFGGIEIELESVAAQPADPVAS